MKTTKFYLSKRNNGFYYLLVVSSSEGIRKQKAISTKENKKPLAKKFMFEYIKTYETQQKEVLINKNITIQEFYKEIYSQLINNLSKNTVGMYDLTIRKFIELIGNKMLRLISAGNIESFKVLRLKQDVSKYEVNKELSILKSAFNIAIKLNYLIKNPCCYVKKYKIEDEKIKVFNDSEIDLLLNNITNTTLLNIVKFALLTGLRLNEILNIQIKDIDYASGIINITNKDNFKTKTGKNKVVIITDKLKELLDTIIIPNKNTNNIFELNSNYNKKYIFTVLNRNKAIDKTHISKLFKRELRKLNLSEDLHFHSLRHTYITNLILKEVPLNIVKEIVSHSNIQTTMKYISIGKKELLTYANKI